MTTVEREAQIAAGTVMLTDEELAPRMGFAATERGYRSVREAAARGAIPGRMVGRKWLFHWPTVVARVTKGKA